jgi:lysophospholipase L1-like esterase
VAIGDSFTSAGSAGDVSKSYPLITGNLLQWPARNFAKGGAQMKDIPAQLIAAASSLANATHVVFTIGGNDLGVASSLLEVILKNNITAVIQKTKNLKHQLIATYKRIQAAVRPETKIYAVPYVDFISVGNKIPNEASCHQVLNVLADTLREATEEVNIGFIESVKLAFRGHEMFSTDTFVDSVFAPSNAAHPNAKGHAKIGQLVAAHISSEQ